MAFLALVTAVREIDANLDWIAVACYTRADAVDVLKFAGRASVGAAAGVVSMGFPAFVE